MNAPRIEIDLRKVRQNAHALVEQLTPLGISVSGVTKSVCGDPAVARAMLAGGAVGLLDTRASNVLRMRAAGITCPITMIRVPMASQAEQIVMFCSASYNSEVATILALAGAATRAGKVHDVILMVEMGDLRDGIMPEDLAGIAAWVVQTPGVALVGLGANFACLNNVAPDAGAMALFCELASETELSCGVSLRLVSGGGSANLPWALSDAPKGRSNELRLGEAILLGTDPVSGEPIEGLYTDAFTLVAEVIEVAVKTNPLSPLPVGSGFLGAGIAPEAFANARAVLAVGFQDTDVEGLFLPGALTFIGATSDHGIVDSPEPRLRVGDEVRCQMNYTALMRAMNAQDVTRVYLPDGDA